MDAETIREKRLSYREGKHRLKSIRWMLFGIAAVQLVAWFIMTLVASFFSAPPPFWFQILVIELSAYLVPISMYARANRLLTARDARERFGLKSCKRSLWPLVILAGIGCQFIMIVLNLPINLILEQSDSAVPTSIFDLLMAVFVVAAIPAVFEEFLFRGIVYGVMKEFNTKAAMLFTTFMFALMHGSLAGLLGYLFLGWASITILRCTGSLYACMAFHFTNNVTALLLSWFSSTLFYLPAETIWLFIVGILVAIVTLVLIKGFTSQAKPTELIKTSVLLEQSIVSLPILLCILCVIGVLTLH